MTLHSTCYLLTVLSHQGQIYSVYSEHGIQPRFLSMIITLCIHTRFFHVIIYLCRRVSRSTVLRHPRTRDFTPYRSPIYQWSPRAITMIIFQYDCNIAIFKLFVHISFLPAVTLWSHQGVSGGSAYVTKLFLFYLHRKRVWKPDLNNDDNGSYYYCYHYYHVFNKI